jgi:hypothetical protein
MMFLHQSDIFNSAIINGVALKHTNSLATLNSTYPANFPASWTQQTGSTFSTGSGQIVVANQPPVATNISMGAQSGVPQTLQIIGGKYAPTDADGDALLVSAVQNPSAQGGLVTNDGTNVTYTALSSFTGADTFTYTVNDGYGGTTTATVTVNVVANGPGFNQLSAQLVGGYEVMSFAGIPGYQYALDWTTNLSLPISWIPVVTNAAATNGFLIFSNPPSGAPQDFYRTRYVP